ncbi:hypothetical protein [Marinobacter sp.]|uniref:hypothetical protein n=1 Tax=Marinobacter sp. TaxID=50741 RepID=UPI00387E517C
MHGYSANYDSELMEVLNQLIDAEPFEVHVAQTFSLDQTVEAHRTLDSHYIGRLALRPN